MKYKFSSPLFSFSFSCLILVLLSFDIHSQPLASYVNPENGPGENSVPAPKLSKAAAKAGAAIVITVGTTKIQRKQIDTLVNLMERAKQTPGALAGREKNSLEKMVATNLIGQELLALEAKRLNVIVQEKEIDSLTKVFKTNFPDDATFKRALAQAGDTEKGLREKMIRQIKADKLLNTQMTGVAKPTEKEIQDFFDAHKKEFPINDSLRACQIVLMTPKEASSGEIAKKKSDLERVRAELNKDSANMDILLSHFVMAAQQVSDGPERKDGGDLQRFNPNDFNPEFKKQVVGLKVGQMSPIFRTPLGWHLVLLTERYDGKFASYRMQISRVLISEKAAIAGKNLRNYLQTLAARYKVTFLDRNLKDTSAAAVYSR